MNGVPPTPGVDGGRIGKSETNPPRRVAVWFGVQFALGRAVGCCQGKGLRHSVGRELYGNPNREPIPATKNVPRSTGRYPRGFRAPARCRPEVGVPHSRGGSPLPALRRFSWCRSQSSKARQCPGLADSWLEALPQGYLAAVKRRRERPPAREGWNTAQPARPWSVTLFTRKKEGSLPTVPTVDPE